MFNNLKDMITNTINFMETPIGIFIVILIFIILIESLIIWLLIWILKNQFNKNKGEIKNELPKSNG